MQLNSPNALWVRGDGTVYVLDTGNARVRRIATNGVMSTLFFAQSDTNSALDGGRCLWVKDDESLAYFGNKTRMRKWTPGSGVQTLVQRLSRNSARSACCLRQSHCGRPRRKLCL